MFYLVASRSTSGKVRGYMIMVYMKLGSLVMEIASSVQFLACSTGYLNMSERYTLLGIIVNRLKSGSYRVKSGRHS
ncbi:hypothetical protein Tco_1434167 [Tanacetum coccineum]